MSDTVRLSLPRAEYEALLDHLRETFRPGAWNGEYATLHAADLTSAVRLLERADRKVV